MGEIVVGIQRKIKRFLASGIYPLRKMNVKQNLTTIYLIVVQIF